MVPVPLLTLKILQNADHAHLFKNVSTNVDIVSFVWDAPNYRRNVLIVAVMRVQMLVLTVAPTLVQLTAVFQLIAATKTFNPVVCQATMNVQNTTIA